MDPAVLARVIVTTLLSGLALHDRLKAATTGPCVDPRPLPLSRVSAADAEAICSKFEPELCKSYQEEAPECPVPPPCPEAVKEVSCPASSGFGWGSLATSACVSFSLGAFLFASSDGGRPSRRAVVRGIRGDRGRATGDRV